jgi:protein tyrosine/serine phosphatase
MGIRTVINLRQFTFEEQAVKDAGMIPFALPMTVLSPIPAYQLVDKIRGLDSITQPILVHCRFGQDRTGLFCASYRIIIDGWTYEEAEEEMLSFIPSQFGEIWQPIRNVLKQVAEGGINGKKDLSEVPK